MEQELVKVTLKLLSSGSTTTENYTAFWTILVKYGKKQKITDDYSVLRYFGQFYTVDLLLPYYMYYTEVARHNLGGKNIYIYIKYFL